MKSPHGLRSPFVGNRQGRDDPASHAATVRCYVAILALVTAPVRWARSLNVGEWLALAILANVVCAMVWGAKP